MNDRINTRCPTCGHTTLIIGSGGHLTCSWLQCSNPSVADAIESLRGTAKGSVLRPWVMELPLREQGTLLTAIRGCDLTPKYPLDSLERRLVAAIRYAVMVPADQREVDSEPGCFMLSEPPDLRTFKPSALGHYPWHWLSHVVHATEVLGYRHPGAAHKWFALYTKLCHSFHLNVETRECFVGRMAEDRIVTGTVVS